MIINLAIKGLNYNIWLAKYNVFYFASRPCEFNSQYFFVHEIQASLYSLSIFSNGEIIKFFYKETQKQGKDCIKITEKFDPLRTTGLFPINY